MDTDKHDIVTENKTESSRATDTLYNADTVLDTKVKNRSQRRRKPRGFKIALLVLLGLLLVVAAGIYFLPSFLPMDTIRGIAKTRVKDMLGMDVDFQNLGFGWDGRVVLDGVTLAPFNQDGTVGEPLLTVDEVRTNVAVSPLLQGKIVVNSLDVNGFSLRVRREADGSLNLPDLQQLTASAPTRTPGRQRLSAMAAETASALPPIEIHRVNLKQGILSFDDRMENRALDVGLDYLTIEGSDINNPFDLSGRLLPYPGATDKGEIPFTGKVALLKDGQFNPDGEAALELDVRAFSFAELAAQVGFGELLPSGRANGLVKAAYSERKGVLSIPELHLDGAAVGIGDGSILPVPDSAVTVTASFDPGPGVVTFTDLALANDFNSVKAKGWVEGIYELAEGGLPAGSFDYTGVIDFAKTADYARQLDLGLDGLPALSGNGSYFGKVTLPQRQQADEALAPTLVLDFSDGLLSAEEPASGIAASVNLAGIGLKTAAILAEPLELNAALAFQNVPISARVPQLGDQPVELAVNGDAALNAGERTAVEVKLRNSRVKVPVTPWSDTMDIASESVHLTYEVEGDLLNIAALAFDINGGVKGNVGAAAITGLAAGAPQGQADVELSTVLDTVRKMFLPLVPPEVHKLAGSVRAANRIRLEGSQAALQTVAELTDADISVRLETAQAAAVSPKTTVGLNSRIDLEQPLAILIDSLEVNSADAGIQMADARGDTLAGRFGVTALKATGNIDAAAGVAQFTALSLAGNSMTMLFGRDGRQSAGMDSGVMQLILAEPENHLMLPLSGTGDFSLPAIVAGVDNLVFYRLTDGNRETSDLGNLRARVGVDGYLGTEKPQIVNLRTATFAAKPLAVNSRGQVDLGTGAMVAEYAARVAPAGLSSLLTYFGLPPALLDDASFQGLIRWNGSQVDTSGAAQGRIRLASGEINPFEMNHDLSAAFNPADRSLAVAIRRLDGNVKSASGEAAVTLAAQQSNLLLSRAGSKGLIDIRLNGSAGPTRTLALGLTGILPQLRDVTDILYKSQASGVYSAWLQVKEKDASSLALNLGGVWQGAALQIDNVPYVAESGRLSASLEGEFAYRDNRVAVTRMLFRSDSALTQADGTMQAVLAADQNHAFTGLSSINVDLRFVAADLAKLPLVFPGLIPSDFGLAGKVDGAFRAGGNADDIRVDQGVVNFQGFQANPGIQLAIPTGRADFGANLSLHLNAPAGSGSPYDVFTLVTIRNGQATLTGAQLQGRPINTMAGTFELQNGVLTLHNAQLAIDGGGGTTAVAAGTVDFTAPAPAATLQVAARNFPLSEVNPEISQFFQVQSGTINLPASGQSAGVSFAGFSEEEILRSLRLSNFNFATGPVVIHTGPVLNAELDKARAIMKQEVTGDNVRTISFQSITGTLNADGNGRINIPSDNPINLVGDNTGDFRVQGHVDADHTMTLEFYIAGKLENLIGFTLPNIIPNLRSGSDEEKNRFMATLNRYASEGRYRVKLSGPLESPDLSGIDEVAGRFMVDIVRAAPGQIIGGAANLVKDAPGALLDAAGAIVNPENITNPSNIINAPRNITRGLGRVFGLDGGGQSDQGQSTDQQQGQQEQQSGGVTLPLPFLRNR